MDPQAQAAAVQLLYEAFGEATKAAYSKGRGLVGQRVLGVLIHVGGHTAAAITFILFDIILNFSEELTHIWRARWTPIKVIYIVTRYYGLLFLVITFAMERQVQTLECSPLPSSIVIRVNDFDPRSCKGYHIFLVCGCTILYITAVNIIFTFRTFALYNRSKKVLAFFVITCTSGYYYGFHRRTSRSLYVFKLSLGYVSLEAYSLCTFTTNLITDRDLWVLADGQCDVGELLRTKPNASSMDRGSCFARIVDGAYFYFVTTLSIVVSAVFSMYKEGMYSLAVVPWVYVAFSYTGSHLVLNLRKAIEEMEPGAIEQSRSAMDFRKLGGNTGVAILVETERTVQWY
ncbi:hypothetical protein CC1G_10435 [Coprinopsis cinerea okayama7|uniref:DUF6533 domain-containing protein n=1 Tax=Coprinopsis cinerea (strain Okayama-7 / 130 / ATCC MYA-4618 / FGSC 9003) TaxID=240176 RepID=A8PDR6_COPC7|nr:hypothetical protein CC1G_10435 [Coprinopsis cinerea okayama7\|eukprot:XP_001840649.2 hypothetical protein CC1G_10435 [Coprinopsis cinerea okayama7\